MSRRLETERPLVLCLDARTWLSEASLREGRPVRLDSVSPACLDRIAELGVRWVWLRGVWDPGMEAREALARSATALEAFREILPDLEPADIDAPPSSVRAYRAREELGGDEGLESFREDLASRDLRLILDFEADRVALDHPWAIERPELFVRVEPGADAGEGLAPDSAFGTPASRAIARAPPEDELEARSGVRTALLLDLERAEARAAVLAELEGVLARADGAHLGGSESALASRASGGDLAASPGATAAEARPFLLEAAAVASRTCAGGLLLVDGSAALRGLVGPDSPVKFLDRRLGELLRRGDAVGALDSIASCGELRGSFLGALDFGGGGVADVPPERLAAAALVSSFSSGGAVFTDREVEGRRGAMDPRLRRNPSSPRDRETEAFYEALIEILGRPEVARGERDFLRVREAWEGNATWRRFFVVLARDSEGRALLVVVNFGPERSQCYVDLAPLETAGREWIFQDLLSLAAYPRDGGDLARRGLYIDLGPWDYNVFQVVPGKREGEAR